MRAASLAGVFLAYLVFSVAATYPLVTHVTDHVAGHVSEPGVPPLNIWSMATVLHKLPTEPWNLFEGSAFYPYDHTLAFSEHLFVPALLAAPWVLLTQSWIVAYNVVTLLTLATAGLGMFLLAREIVGDTTACFAAGLLYAFHTWNINELVRLQILSNCWFPFVLLALLRFFSRPNVRGAILVGVFYTLQSLSCMYWGFYLAFFVAGTLVFLQTRHRVASRKLAPLFISLGLAVGITGLFVVPYVLTSSDLGFWRSVPASLGIDRYFDVLPGNVLYGSVLGRARWDQNAAHFLGFGSVGLGLLGAMTGRAMKGRGPLLRWFLPGMTLAAFVLGLGPQLRWEDTVLAPGPYALLYQFVPGFQNVRYPERLTVFLVLGLAPLVAAGLARLRPRIGRFGILTLCGVVFLEHLSVPVGLSPMPPRDRIPEVYHWLASQPDVRAVAEVPARRYLLERLEARLMYYSIFHWKRTVQGFTGHFPPTYSYLRWRLFHFPEADSIEFLRRFGVDTIVVDPKFGPVAPDSRWTSYGPFQGGHTVLRLLGVGDPGVVPVPPEDSDVREIERGFWNVRASRPGAELALDGDLRTAWTTEQRQEQGDFYRIRFARTEIVKQVSIAVSAPFRFPMHLKLRGKRQVGDSWEEIPFDQAAAYDGLLARLIHEPRRARLDVKVAPRPLRAIRLQISETDGFGMPWTMAEVHVYSQPPGWAGGGPQREKGLGDPEDRRLRAVASPASAPERP